MNLFTPTPPPSIPAAQAIAADILASSNEEMQHRISNHRLGFDKFWKSQPVTPDDILAALSYEDALKMLQASRLNLENLAALASLNGLTLIEVFPPEGWNPPREFVVTDTRITLGPPAEGFDAWGELIPVPPVVVEPETPSEDPQP